MRTVLMAATLAAVLQSASGAMAQTYPSRPITMVVPLGVGGSTDVIARIMAEGMRASLGQPIIVENTTGAGGTIGVGRVARAAPDGYTIGIGQWGTNVASGAIYPLQYDLIRDFEPVALIATQPFAKPKVGEQLYDTKIELEIQGENKRGYYRFYRRGVFVGYDIPDTG